MPKKKKRKYKKFIDSAIIIEPGNTFAIGGVCTIYNYGTRRLYFGGTKHSFRIDMDKTR